MQQDGRLPLLTMAARHAWYQYKNLHDYPRQRLIRREISRGVPTDIHEKISFVMDRFGGTIRPIQDRAEITEFYRLVAGQSPRAVLEIGTAKGGTLFLLCQAARDDAIVISLDLPYARNGGGYPRWKEPTYAAFARSGQKLVLLRADSHDPASFVRVEAALEGRKLDLIMIDGDHSYEGVRADFEMYSRLLAPNGMIALHDILENKRDPTIDVHRFWTDFAARYRSQEIVRDPAQGKLGIGIVWPDSETLAV